MNPTQFRSVVTVANSLRDKLVELNVEMAAAFIMRCVLEELFALAASRERKTNNGKYSSPVGNIVLKKEFDLILNTNLATPLLENLSQVQLNAISIDVQRRLAMLNWEVVSCSLIVNRKMVELYVELNP